MLCRTIFCITFSLAILSVILLSLFSPMLKNHPDPNSRLAILLYIQPPQLPASTTIQPPLDSGAFIFRHALTEGPENTSRIIGKAQGFIIPIGQFAHSDFNVIYLTFDTPKYSGSLSVRAKHIGNEDREELTVVGGTGSFAFARGLAVFARTDGEGTSYNVKLQLRFPHEYSQSTGG